MEFEIILNRIFQATAGYVTILMFCWGLEHRKNLIPRLLAGIVVFAAREIVANSIDFGDFFIWRSLYNIAFFFLASLAMLLCFNEKYWTILFCCLAGKCTGHVAEYLCKIIFIVTDVVSVYITIVLYIAVFIAIYFLFARRIRTEGSLGTDNVKSILFVFVILTVTDVLNMIFVGYRVTNPVKAIMYVMSMLVCLAVLFLQFGQFTENKMKRETEILKQLRCKDREQYEISQETIKLIGIKHHDIKNMLESHRNKFTDEEIDAINKSIDAYGIIYKTGNDTLDTVLTEKYLACKSKNIRMECDANGDNMNFMDDLDVYSLFINALNNAIESTEKIVEEGKRWIHTRVYMRGNLLMIQILNSYEEEPVFRNNQITTTKTDKNYHGFGIQSMTMIAEKYGGSLSVKAEDKIFSLGIVIPVPESSESK
ncbi:MAG: ATP-binding protein [Candidatus Coproplasma sp.]